VQVVIHDRGPADGDCEDIRKFLQSKFDPLSAVERSFGEQECAADATGDAGIPARHGDVDELRAGHRHGWFLSCDRPKLPKAPAAVCIATCVLFLPELGDKFLLPKDFLMLLFAVMGVHSAVPDSLQ
jgi:hypothetical protein